MASRPFHSSIAVRSKLSDRYAEMIAANTRMEPQLDSWRSNGHTVWHTRGLARKSVESYGMLRIIRSLRSMSIRTQKSCGLFLCGPLICKDCPSTMSWTWTTRWASLVILKHFETTLFIFIIYLSFFIYCGSCKCRLCPTSCPSRDWQTIASLCELPRHFSIDLLKGRACDSRARDLSCQPANWTEFRVSTGMKHETILYHHINMIYCEDLCWSWKYFEIFFFFVCSWSWYMIYVYYIIYI